MKNVPTVGTRSFSFDFPGSAAASWWTCFQVTCVSIAVLEDQSDLVPTVVGDQILHIQHDLCITLVCVGCDSLQDLAMILVDDCGLGVQDERHS